MDNLIASAGQYGALGLTLLASFWYIQKKDVEHVAERTDWNDRLEKMHEEAITAINNNTSVLSSIGAIIKNK